MFNLHDSGIVTLLTGSSGFLCAIAIPILGRLSFLKMFLPCPVVIKNGASSEIQPLDCILTMIFPMMLIVSLVKPQYNSRWVDFQLWDSHFQLV